MEDMVLLARNKNGTLSSAENATEQGPFSCFGCNGELVLRRAHFRSRKNLRLNSATRFSVRQHFAHVADGYACSRNETWLHSAAKYMLATEPLHPMVFHCTDCDIKYDFHLVSESDVRGVVEYRMPNGRIVDVALLVGDQCVGVLEVCHSHPCDDSKLLDLTDMVQDAWAELSARNIVYYMQKKQPIPISVCSASRCAGCKEKFERKATDLMCRTIGDGHACSSTQLHLMAKQMLKAEPFYPLVIHCAVCDTKCEVRLVSAANVRGVMDYCMPNGMIVDVALLSGDRCVGVFKVCCSRRPVENGSKADDNDDNQLLELAEVVQDAWAEVNAANVVHCMQKQQPIPLSVCSISRCTQCKEKLNEKVARVHCRLLVEIARRNELEQLNMDLKNATEDRIQEETSVSLNAKRKRIYEKGGDTVLNFGKYKGLALEAVFEEDLRYVLWLARGKSEYVDSIAVNTARRLCKGLCRGCGDKINGPDWKTLCLDCYREKCI